MAKHYKKLLLLVFIPYMVYFLAHISVRNALFVMPDLLFISNFFSYPDSPFGDISVGTYWYLGLCFELYVFYALFHKLLKNKWFVSITLIISLLSITIPDLQWIRYSKFHFLGWLPSFYFGFYTAKINIDGIAPYKRYLVFAVALPLYLFTSLNQYLWFISDVLGVLCFISIANIVNSKVLRYVGVISSSLFVCHPLIRNAWVHFLGNEYMNQSIIFILLSSVAYILVCLLVAELYNRLLNKIKVFV